MNGTITFDRSARADLISFEVPLTFMAPLFDWRRAGKPVLPPSSLGLPMLLNVALNNSEVGGDWDAAKLMALVVDLKSTPEIDPTLTGFDEHQLRGLQFEPAPPPDDENSQPSNHHVLATLDIPYARWAAARVWLDDLLGEEPTVRLHVKLPSAE